MLSKISKLLFATLVAASLLNSAFAIPCVAVDEGNVLYRFDSATPASTTTVAITGLPMGYRIVGLDFRTTVRTSGAANPGVGSLWALGTDGTLIRLFTINPATGAATLIGSLPGITYTMGSDNGWFFGFDPASDTLRIMNFIYNYEVNPNTLAVTAQTQFNNPSAVNPNSFPALNGSAYTTSSFGGSSQIYFLEQNNDGLNTSTNIAAGNYSDFPAPVGVAFSQPAGLDIAGDLMLASCFDTVSSQQRLYAVNRSTGAFTLIGPISATPGTLSLRALAIQPTSFPAAPSIVVTIKGKKKVQTTSPRVVLRGTVRSNIGIDRVEYRVGNRGKFRRIKGKLTPWKATVALKPNRNVVQVRAVRGPVVSRPARVTVIRN